MTKHQLSIAIVGTGNFATNLEALCRHYGLPTRFFVDEFRQSPFLDLPVYKASQLSQTHISSVSKFLLAISHPEHQQAAYQRLRQQGIAAQKIMRIADDPGLQILQLLFAEYQQQAVAKLCSSDSGQLEDVEKHFLEPQWQQVLTTLKPNKANIGLAYYGRGGGFRRHISPLIPHLEHQYNLLSFSDETMNQAEEAKQHLYMSSFSACQQHWLDLVISAHVFACAPKSVPRVSFSHVIYDFNLTGDYHAARIGEPDTHYLFASSKACFEWYRRLIDKHQLSNRLCIIPGGYLQLDRNIELAQAYQGQQDSILYAPTLALADYPHRDLASSMEHAVAIVQALLEAFPQMRIIVRPHPSDLRLYQLNRKDQISQAFERLMQYCDQQSNCFIDDNATNYMNSYNRSAVLVSDTSSTAFTYAFTTQRPVVFFSAKESQLQQQLAKQLKFIQDREQLGQVVESIPQLQQAVASMLGSTLIIEQINAFRRQTIFNPGTAAQYFSDNLPYILNQQRHPDWLYINWSDDD